MSKASLELGGGNWAAKDGKLLGYAVGDTSGKYLPREFEFSRGADIGATRVNKDGLVEKYRENALINSGDFSIVGASGGWVKNASTITSGYAGYDGTTNAWKFESTVLTSYNNLNQQATYNAAITPLGSKVATFSVYLKAGTTNWVRLNLNGTGNVYFDLENGVVGTATANILGQIKSAGNGFYRCSITRLGGGVFDGCYIYLAESDENLLSNTHSTPEHIFVQNPQLEYGLVATDYLESDDETGKAGVLDDLPRIDYTSGSAQLLMEPSRTNLIPSSEYFNSGYGLGSLVTVTDNYAISPEGVKNASRWIGSAGSYPQMTKAISGLTIGVDYVLSIYVKSDGTSQIAQSLHITGGGNTTSFTPNDEWQRVEYSFTATATSHTTVLFTNSNTAPSSSYLIYGYQLEAGSYATSYIPNYGTALGVTRNFDYFYDQTFNNVLGNGDISMLVDFDYASPTREDSTTVVSLRSGSDILGIKGDSTTDRDLQIYAAGNFSGAINFNDTEQDTRIKALIRTSGTTVELFFNGEKDAETITFPAVNLPYAWDDLRVTGNDSLLAKFNRIAIFTESLSDAECIALTTV
jgi:hypothetical protein